MEDKKARFTPGPWVSRLHSEKNAVYDTIENERNLGPETICTVGGLPTIPLDGGAIGYNVKRYTWLRTSLADTRCLYIRING